MAAGEVFVRAHLDEAAYRALELAGLGACAIQIFCRTGGADDQLDAMIVEHVDQPGETPCLAGQVGTHARHAGKKHGMKALNHYHALAISLLFPALSSAAIDVDAIKASFDRDSNHRAEASASIVAQRKTDPQFDTVAVHSTRVGLLLVPVGILKKNHEPPAFYGVERNPVESNIVPNTWWGSGAGVNGELTPGLHYDVAITSGLNVPTKGGSAYKVRDGSQKGARVAAEDLAYMARLRWTALPGIELAGTVHYEENVTQAAAGVDAILFEAHAIANRGPFALRALYANWNLDGKGPAAAGRDEQRGWYLEPSYKVLTQLGVFARYNEWDNEAGDSAASRKKQINVGVNYRPHKHVVLKADVQNQGGATNNDGLNLGISYRF